MNIGIRTLVILQKLYRIQSNRETFFTAIKFFDNSFSDIHSWKKLYLDTALPINNIIKKSIIINKKKKRKDKNKRISQTVIKENRVN